MGRRLPALFALVAGLLLGAGAVATGLGPTVHDNGDGVVRIVADGSGHTAASASSGREAGTGVPSSPRPMGGTVVRVGHTSSSGSHLRSAAALAVGSLFTVALVAFVGRERRRRRPPSRHGALLFARGPPLLLAP